MVHVQPLKIAANMPRSFDRGAGRIDRLRGVPAHTDPYHPEDWIGSVTARSDAGQPQRPDHAARRLPARGGHRRGSRTAGWAPGMSPATAPDPADPGQAPPTPVSGCRCTSIRTATFARTHLAASYGKTEAWIVVEAAPDAVVHLGFHP